MTNTINHIQEYNTLINAIITTHNDLKIKSQLAYQHAVEHAKAFNDWFLLADFIDKLLINKIATGQHLYKVMKATNEKLQYNAKKKSISQMTGFEKEKTQAIQNIWSDEYTGKTEKQAVVFNEIKMIESIKNLIKKAIKNNIDKNKIKQALSTAVVE